MNDDPTFGKPRIGPAMNASQLALSNVMILAGQDAWLRGQLKAVAEQSEADPGVDFDDVYIKLVSARQTRAADLVRYMKDRPAASFQDLNDKCFGVELEDASIRGLVSKANSEIAKIEPRLSFSTPNSHVMRHISPRIKTT